jgi:cytochrome c biogenesis protein CcdA
MNTRLYTPRIAIRLLHPPSLLLAVVSLFILSQQRAFSQQSDTAHNAVNWEFSAVKSADGNPILVLHASIRNGWKLYSTTNPDTVGNSRVNLDSGAAAKILSIEEKGVLQRKKDPIFNGTITNFFTGDAQWLVHIQPTGSAATGDLKGAVTFIAVYKDSVVGPLDIPFRYGHTSDGGLIAKSTDLREATSSSDSLRLSSIDLSNPINKCGGTGAEDSGSQGLLSIFFLGFLGGLLGLIMPCTFPMIPLTVSFFTKRSASRSKGIANAFLYGFFIFLIYILISVPFYFLKANNANILNTISTNIWLNISFAVIFLVFALSFFGLFEITLPSSVSNSVDAKSSIGSIGGIFFMALTLAIVSFSCTGPILGTLLVGALGQNGGAVQLSVAMAGFGLALGLPFRPFRPFPQLAAVPAEKRRLDEYSKDCIRLRRTGAGAEIPLECRPGQSLGPAEKRDLLGLWILSDRPRTLSFRYHQIPSRSAAAQTEHRAQTDRPAFPGFWALPAARPHQYKICQAGSLSAGSHRPGTIASTTAAVRRHLINDYEKALELAKEQHKPILIDFTGWACTNCRNMEENVWPKAGVQELINNDYILVSLYVDDRKTTAG